MQRVSERVDLLVVLVGCALYLAVLFAPGHPPPLVHVVAGLLLVLVLPGHALLRTLGIGSVDAATQVLLVVAMSLAVTILMGLVLAFVPGLALDAAHWRRASALLTGGLALLGFVSGAPAPAAHAPPPLRHLAWGLLPLAIVATAAVLSVRSAASVPSPAFTELWAIRTSEERIEVGVRNREGEPRTYRVAVQPPADDLSSARDVRLEDGATWSWSITITAALLEGGHEVWLLREGDDAPYRRVALPTGSPGGEP